VRSRLAEPAYISFARTAAATLLSAPTTPPSNSDTAKRIVFFDSTGFDEGDEICGSGSAELEDDGTIEIEQRRRCDPEGLSRMPSSTACSKKQVMLAGRTGHSRSCPTLRRPACSIANLDAMVE
jgi:hypothetical protein